MGRAATWRAMCEASVAGARRPRESRVSAMPAVNEAVVIAFRDAAEFEAWLDAHVDLRVGVWLQVAKERAGVPSLTDDEAGDLRPCYGLLSPQPQPLRPVSHLHKA